MSFELNEDNYYSEEADMAYMSVSQYKNFAGSYGRRGCEFQAMMELKGKWREEPSTALLVGSYVDAYFEGTLPRFQMDHPELFNKDGSLKSYYKAADTVIQRVTKDAYFMKYMSGEKQKIMTGNIGGVPWKIKMDSYIEGVAIVDLKVMKSITEMKWVKDLGYLDFVRYWGYDIQGAVYQEVVRQNTGKQLPFYIAAATKENEPDIRIIQITQNYLDEALKAVENGLPGVLRVKNGEREPDRCETCDCCRHFRVLTNPITIDELTADI